MQFCWCQGHRGRGLESDWAGGKLSSYIIWWAISWMRFSIAVFVCECVCVCAMYTSVFMFLCSCHCVYESLCGSQQDPGSVLPITTWQREQMGFSESAHSLDSPASALPPHPPLPPSLQPLHPPRPAVQGFCNFIKVPDHSFTVRSTLENRCCFLKCRVSSPSNTLPQ